MSLDIAEPGNILSSDAAEAIAACLSVLAEMKSLKFSVAECRAIAAHVAAHFSSDDLSAFLADNTRRPCSVVEAANAALDRAAAFQVVRIFEKVRGVAPLSQEVVDDLTDEILMSVPARKPGDPVYQWPDPMIWEQMAASRFAVATPHEREQFGAGIVSDAGRC